MNRLSNDCYSYIVESVPAGIPQDTKLGPWLFLIMINVLNVSGVDDLWKYVDDSTISESVSDNDPSILQNHVDEFTRKSEADGFQLKESKCKELRISFSTYDKIFHPILINGKNIEVAPSVKLLGLAISDDLKRKTHISRICKKISSRLYFLRQLKRAKVPSNDLLLFYVTCIHAVTEYACQVFHDSLPQYLFDELEKLQKRAIRIIFPDMHYKEDLETMNISSLHDRRQSLTDDLFNEIVIINSHHERKSLLPPLNGTIMPLRNRRKFQIPIYKTNRFKNSLIMSNLFRYLNSYEDIST